MYLSSSFLLCLLTTIHSSIASPITPRTCQSLAPSTLQTIAYSDSGIPLYGPNTASTTNLFSISKIASTKTTIYQSISFAPPAGSPSSSCTLMLSFPPNYPITISGIAAPKIKLVSTELHDNGSFISVATGLPIKTDGSAISVHDFGANCAGLDAGFMFGIDAMVTEDTNISWKNSAGAGIYLSYDC